MENRIIFDYLAFSSTIDSPDSIIKLLGLSDDIVSSMQCGKGFYGYLNRLYFDGISIHFNGSSNMGVCLEMSGKGCRNFEQFGNGDYNALFNYICDNKEVNITRLDVAYDDFNKILDIDTIFNDIVSQNYVSRFKSFPVEFVLSKDCSKISKTLYFGSRKSNILYRMYDKRAEQKSNLDHWVRLELQVRDDNANSFIETFLSVNNLADVYFSVLNNYIRFVAPNGSDSNISRAPLAHYWEKFLQCLCKTSLFRPCSDFTESNLENYVKKQCSSSIISFIALFGFNNFIDFLRGRAKFDLNPRHKALLLQHNIKVDDIYRSLDVISNA